MRTNTQEATLPRGLLAAGRSAYIASLRKRTPRDAAQDAAELCRLATSLNRLRVSGFVLTNPDLKNDRLPSPPSRVRETKASLTRILCSKHARQLH